MVRVDIPGRDRLDAEEIGEIAEEREPSGVSALERALELDVEALAAESACESCRRVRIEQSEPSPRTARQADETLVQLGNPLEGYRRRKRLAILFSDPARARVRLGQEPAEVRVSTPR